MKLNKMLIFSMLGVFLIAGLFSTNIYARGKGSKKNTSRYSGVSSYSSSVTTQNQNYVATTDTNTTGITSDPLSGSSSCDDEGLCTKCKRLVRQSLQSYCRENECSKASNAFIIAKALPLSSTSVNIDAPEYDSPSTSMNQSDAPIGQALGYDQELVLACQPHLVKNVENLLPAYYDIVTKECHTQYKTAIEHYMFNNTGGFKMGSTGEKRTIRNFEILEYFKHHNTNVYDQSLYYTGEKASSVEGTTTTNANIGDNDDAITYQKNGYYFSDYCMKQMADSVKLALIDTHIPDIFTYQRNMCRRSYEMAMQAYCDGGEGGACKGEIDYMALIMNQEFLESTDASRTSSSYQGVTSDQTQINCGTELAQDVREALIEEVVRKQNMCSRQIGQYNAEQDKCMFNIALIDAQDKEIERKMFFEGENVKCNEKDFVDPYSKIGRKRAGVISPWMRSKTGASIIYGSAGAGLGLIVGFNVGQNIAQKTRINRAMNDATVPDAHREVLKSKIMTLSGKTLAEGQTKLKMDGFSNAQAKVLIEQLYYLNDDKELTLLPFDSKTGKRIGMGVGGVVGGVGAVAGTNLVYSKLYKETKCYKTWRSSRLGEENVFGELEVTDRIFTDWGKSKTLPRITEGLKVNLDSLPTYDREYKGDPKWEDK